MKTEDGNEGLHPWIEPELEARLTALVLGEASDFERDELERLVAERPELGLYRRRLEAMHRMLREVSTGESAEEQGEWKLAPERRAAVLERLGNEEAPPETTPVRTEKRSPWSLSPRFMAIAAAVVLVGLLLGVMFPASTGSLRFWGSGRDAPRNVLAYYDTGEVTKESDWYFREGAKAEPELPGAGDVLSSGRYGVPLDGVDKMHPAQKEWQQYPGHPSTKTDVDLDAKELALADQAIRLPAPTSATPAPPAEPMAVDKSGQIGALNGTVAIGAGGDIALGVDPNSPTKLSITASGNSSTNVRVGGGFDGRDEGDRPLAGIPVTSTLGGENTNTGGREISVGGGVLAIANPEPPAAAPPSPASPAPADREMQRGLRDEAVGSIGAKDRTQEGVSLVEADKTKALDIMKQSTGNATLAEVPAARQRQQARKDLDADSDRYEAEEKPLMESERRASDDFGTFALNQSGPAPIASPKPLAAEPVSGPVVADPEARLTTTGAGTLALNGGTVDLSMGEEIVEFDGFIDHKTKTDAPKSAPSAGGNLNFTGDMQVNGGVEAKGNASKESLSLGSGGMIAGVSGQERREGFGNESPAKLDALSRSAGSGVAAGQESDVSRMGRSVAVEKSLSQATELEVKRESTGDWGKAPVGKATIDETVALGGEISAGYMSDYIFYGNRMNESAGSASPRPLKDVDREKTDVPALATPSADLNTTVFQVPPTFLSTEPPGAKVADPFADPVSAGGGLAPAGRVTAKQILESAGISFPEGAAAIYNAETSQLIVRNTPDQTELVEAFVDSVAGSDESESDHLFTRHFLGGANSLRGFDYRDVGQRSDVDKSVQDILALTPQVGQASSSGTDAGLRSGESQISEGIIDDQALVLSPLDVEKGEFLKSESGVGLKRDMRDSVAKRSAIPPVVRQPTPAALDETSPSAEPFSTFSLHVSDVSFQLAKAALASGKWPEAEKIRIEEFVNAFDYGDPVPSMGERVACRIDQAAHPFLQQRNLVRIALRTAEAGRSSGTPLRLTLLLDSSGSMERPDRRATLTRAVATLAGLLGENDRITLVSFARQPRLVADAVAGNEAMKLAETVAALPSEGGTNLEAALELAFEKAREHQEANAQNRIVLLTDGAANLGDAKAESLGVRVEMMRDAGIAFDAAGFGAEGLNDEILEALTRKGDGRYYLLDRPEDAGEVFAEQIAGALRPAAKNVKVQVEFNSDRVKSYKLLGFEKHRLATEDFRNDAVDAAEMAAAEAGVAVYQVEPDPAGEGDLGSVSVRFRDLESGEMIERRWALPHLASAPAADQGGDAILLATVASQFAAKLGGGPLGDVVDLGELASLAAALPDSPRVAELRTMIEQARAIEGAK